MSTAALVGFVSSLVICIPLLTQLLGAILGIFGVVQTSGGRRRGRGLAIAAICISLLAAVVWVGVGFAGYTVITSANAILTDTKPLFSSPEADLQMAASRLRDEHFSARLKLRVDEQAVQDFARQVIARHGRLRGFRPADRHVGEHKHHAQRTAVVEGDHVVAASGHGRGQRTEDRGQSVVDSG